MKYIKPIDGLRAVAILMVIVTHWLQSFRWVRNLSPGSFGVDLFFVISGFLISGILFQQRDNVEAANASRKQLLSGFYLRRTLRIFPIYYLLLFLLIALKHPLHLPLQKTEMICALTYTSNFYVHAVNDWPPYTTPFWSLAVEEQFYLVWPWLIVFLPRRWTLPTIVALIGLSVCCRFFSDNYEFGYRFVHTCFDSLGLGALLAWLALYRPQILQKLHPWFFVLGLAGAVIAYGPMHDGYFELHQIRLLDSLCSFGIVSFVLMQQHSKNWFVSVLSWKPLVAIGRISYGIYLFHLPFAWQAWRIWGWMENKKILRPHWWNSYLIFAVDLLLLLGICAASWHFIEKPILRLKRFVSYNKEESKADAPFKELQSVG